MFVALVPFLTVLPLGWPADRADLASDAVSQEGSARAYVLDTRIGLRLPIGGSILLMIGMLFGMVWGSGSAMLFLVYISLLQIGWIFLNCYLYSALIDANNLLVPAATPLSTFGSAMGASAMGYVLEHNGLAGTLELSVGALVATAMLTLPFLRAAVPSLPLADELDCSRHPQQ